MSLGDRIIYFFLDFGFVRRFLWRIFESLSFRGRHLLTLRQYRSISFWLNKMLLKGRREQEGHITTPIKVAVSPKAHDLIRNGWCKITGQDEGVIRASVQDARQLAKKMVAVTQKRPNPYVLADSRELLKLDSFNELLRLPDLWEIASSYMGCEIYLRDADIVYSDLQEELIASQLYHLDNIGYKALRLILLIEDVEVKNGPFTTYELENSAEIIKRLRLLDRRDYGMLSDSEMAAFESEFKPVKLLGSAGDLFFADTCSCLHHGSRVSEGHRLLMMATFAPVMATNLRSFRRGDGEPRSIFLPK